MIIKLLIYYLACGLFLSNQKLNFIFEAKAVLENIVLDRHSLIHIYFNYI